MFAASNLYALLLAAASYQAPAQKNFGRPESNPGGQLVKLEFFRKLKFYSGVY